MMCTSPCHAILEPKPSFQNHVKAPTKKKLRGPSPLPMYITELSAIDGALTRRGSHKKKNFRAVPPSYALLTSTPKGIISSWHGTRPILRALNPFFALVSPRQPPVLRLDAGPRLKARKKTEPKWFTLPRTAGLWSFDRTQEE